MPDLLDSRQYRIRYRIGKSKDVHEVLLIAFDIVEARQVIAAKHRDGLLYPPLSCYNPLRIVSIDDVS